MLRLYVEIIVKELFPLEPKPPSYVEVPNPKECGEGRFGDVAVLRLYVEIIVKELFPLEPKLPSYVEFQIRKSVVKEDLET